MRQRQSLPHSCAFDEGQLVSKHNYMSKLTPSKSRVTCKADLQHHAVITVLLTFHRAQAAVLHKRHNNTRAKLDQALVSKVSFRNHLAALFPNIERNAKAQPTLIGNCCISQLTHFNIHRIAGNVNNSVLILSTTRHSRHLMLCFIKAILEVVHEHQLWSLSKVMIANAIQAPIECLQLRVCPCKHAGLMTPCPVINKYYWQSIPALNIKLEHRQESCASAQSVVARQALPWAKGLKLREEKERLPTGKCLLSAFVLGAEANSQQQAHFLSCRQRQTGDGHQDHWPTNTPTPFLVPQARTEVEGSMAKYLASMLSRLLNQFSHLRWRADCANESRSPKFWSNWAL